MTCTIGRAALTSNPYNVNLQGRALSFNIDLVGSTVDEMKALRQQLAGIVDNRDETVIPFTWSEDATLDGFYRVTGVTVPSTPVQLVSGFISGVQVSLEQVTGFAQPQFEVQTQAQPLTLVPAITATPTTIVTVTNSAAASSGELDDPFAAAGLTRTASNGTVVQAKFVAGPISQTTYRWGTVPASFYLFAATIELKYGSTWFTAVGRNIPAKPDAWRITNGLVRLTSAIQAGTVEGLLEIWDGSTWDTVNVSHWRRTGGGVETQQPLGLYAVPTILRNSPECVAIRCPGFTTRSVTYTVRWGQQFVAWADTDVVNHGFRLSAGPALSAITGGLRETAANSGGNKVVLAVASAILQPTAGTGIGGAAGTRLGMAGVELGGASGQGLGPSLIEQWAANTLWTQRIVVR